MADKFAFASHAPMLFARFLDHFEVNRLKENITDICHDVIGSRQTVQYTPEIALVSRALYYSCSMLGFGVTPGQGLCDFSLVESHLSDGQQSSGRRAVSKASKDRIYIATALYSILPYIYERKTLIWSHISAMLDIVATPEPDLLLSTPVIAVPNTAAASSSNTGSGDAAATETGSNDTGGTPQPPPRQETSIDPFLTKVLRAVAAAVASISSSGNERVEALCAFLGDVHRFLFFQYGSFLEIPLRIAQLRLVTRSPSKNQGSLKAIAWLLGFRISLLVYYATRVLLAEIDREQHRPTVTGAGAAAGVAGEGSGPSTYTGPNSSSSTNNGGSSSGSGGGRAKCALCMDPLNRPAAIPCGHIFCWGCVVAHVRSSSGRSGGGSGGSAGGGLARCPICRAEFLGQRVRALYNYL